MNVYLFATLLGLLGLIVMAGLGMAHSLGGEHGHSAGQGHDPAQPHAHGPPGHADASWLLSLASPRLLFSLALGFGLSGLLLRSLLPVLLLLPAAIVGALLFEWLLIRPYWQFLLRFESSPSKTLASVAGQPAQAATDFDVRGAGLVVFELNGETRQLLARLQPDGAPVPRGTALTIESIDEPTNSCTVRRS